MAGEERISIKEYVDSRLLDRDAALVATAAAHEKRLDALNEIRGALEDQAKTFVTREEMSGQIKALGTDISALRDQTNKFMTRDEICGQMNSITKDIKNLELSKAEVSGKASQLSANINYLFTAIALLISSIGIVLHFIK